MEIPEPELRDGLVAVLLASFGYIWKRLNGDIKAAKVAAQLVSERTVAKEVLAEYMARAEQSRLEFRGTLIKIFEEMKQHNESDSKRFEQIAGSLARLEERSQKRRQGE